MIPVKTKSGGFVCLLKTLFVMKFDFGRSRMIPYEQFLLQTFDAAGINLRLPQKWHQLNYFLLWYHYPVPKT